MSPIGSKIDFKGDLVFESAVLFFVIILKFIFTSIFEIKFHEKNSSTPKKFIFENRLLLTIIYLTKVLHTAYREQWQSLTVIILEFIFTRSRELTLNRDFSTPGFFVDLRWPGKL